MAVTTIRNHALYILIAVWRALGLQEGMKMAWVGRAEGYLVGKQPVTFKLRSKALVNGDRAPRAPSLHNKGRAKMPGSPSLVGRRPAKLSTLCAESL